MGQVRGVFVWVRKAVTLRVKERSAKINKLKILRMRRLVRLSNIGSFLCERRGWCFTLVHSLHPVCRHDGTGSSA